MRVIGLIEFGPNWRPGVPLAEQGEPMEQHLAYMRQLFDAGHLLLGGPFAARGGGIAVFEVDSVQHARELTDADPATVAGVLTYDVAKLHAVFDAFGGVRTSGQVSEVARTMAEQGQR